MSKRRVSAASVVNLGLPPRTDCIWRREQPSRLRPRLPLRPPPPPPPSSNPLHHLARSLQRLRELLVAVRRGNECRLELRGRQVDAARDHARVPLSEPRRVGRLRGVPAAHAL